MKPLVRGQYVPRSRSIELYESSRKCVIYELLFETRSTIEARPRFLSTLYFPFFSISFYSSIDLEAFSSTISANRKNPAYLRG